MSTFAILLAAGSGTRMQGVVGDKVLTSIHGKPVILYSIEAFAQSKIVDEFIIVYRDVSQMKKVASIIEKNDLGHLNIQTVQGGSDRQTSVFSALKIIDPMCTQVFIHDCARPCLRSEAIKELNIIAKQDGAACLAHPIVDTIKRIRSSDNVRKQKLENLDRTGLWAMETPQVFNFKNILEAYENVAKKNLRVTDDASAYNSIGLKCSLVSSAYPNPKLTSVNDLVYIEYLLKKV